MPLTAEIVRAEIAKVWPDCEWPCVELSSNSAYVERPTGGTTLRPGGLIPGPTQFAIADCVLWYLTFGAIDRIVPMAVTSELSIRFLRPCQGEVLKAYATLEKAGRRSVVGTVHVWTDSNRDRPSAAAQGTYMLPAE